MDRAAQRRSERDEARRAARVARIRAHAFAHPWRGDRILTCPDHGLETTAITEPGRPTRVRCSFDQHYHGSGWFKNSDYEQCLHVSISHVAAGETEIRHIPPDLGGGVVVGAKLETPSDIEVWAWARAFFGDDARLAWLEPAASVLDPYRMPNIAHARLYYDQAMRPFMPAGEVYTLRPLAGLSPPQITEGAAGGDAR